jgi:hypothetical protein
MSEDYTQSQFLKDHSILLPLPIKVSSNPPTALLFTALRQKFCAIVFFMWVSIVQFPLCNKNIRRINSLPIPIFLYFLKIKNSATSKVKDSLCTVLINENPASLPSTSVHHQIRSYHVNIVQAYSLKHAFDCREQWIHQYSFYLLSFLVIKQITTALII